MHAAVPLLPVPKNRFIDCEILQTTDASKCVHIRRYDLKDWLGD